jgi:SRSO17 transposase
MPRGYWGTVEPVPASDKKPAAPRNAGATTKAAIALGLLKQARGQGIPRCADERGPASDTAFREAVTALGLPYVMGVGPTTSVWAPGVRPLAQTKPWSGKGPRPLLRLRRHDERKPTSVKELALNLPERPGRSICSS